MGNYNIMVFFYNWWYDVCLFSYKIHERAFHELNYYHVVKTMS